MMRELDSHEAEILRFLEQYHVEHGRAPSFDEIREAVGLKSKDHVSRDLKRLEQKGFLRLNARVARGIRLLVTAEGRVSGAHTFQVPLLGTIAAGLPIPVPEGGLPGAPSDLIELTRDIVKNEDSIYALRVKGTSMIDALVNDGDIVIMRHQEHVENGEMAAVWLTDRQETTLKRFFLEGKRVRLQPENRGMQPIYVSPKHVQVQGKVIAVIRQV
jgi:repressor LexA